MVTEQTPMINNTICLLMFVDFAILLSTRNNNPCPLLFSKFDVDLKPIYLNNNA